jgi:hypothetical protein
MIKITHYSTTSNGEQMAAWISFESPIIITADKLNEFRRDIQNEVKGTIYLRYEEVEDDGQNNTAV